VIIAADDGGRSMGLVLEGVVQVEKGDRVLGVLGEGELFGDMAFVLETRRTARVVAGGDDTRVLLFSQSGPKRVKDPADQAVLWRNLARVIAQRLLQRERG
jgi:CRP-like cAMP-binding protein